MTNRQQLIDYIRKNSFFYSGALFYCFSNEQLLQLKKRIEQQKEMTTNIKNNITMPIQAVGSCDPRAGSCDPRAGSYDPRAGSYDPRNGSYDPRAGSYDPRAVNEQFSIIINN